MDLRGLILSSYISRWPSSLLSLVALGLLLLVCFFIWRSGQLLRFRTLKKESYALRSANALRQLRVIGPKLAIALVLLTAGWGMNEVWQYHHTFILWDLKVVAEPGDQVSVNDRIKIVPQNTFYFQRATGPSGQIFPRTFCSKYVPGLHDGYRIEVLVATAEHYPIDCWNVAPTPLGIVYNQGE